MLRNDESETEIVLGNKQLIGIFFVVAILLGIAFTGGYMVGRGSTGKKTTTALARNEGALPTDTASGGGETHSMPADSGDLSRSGNQAAGGGPSQQAPTAKVSEPARTAQLNEEPPLGSPARKTFEQAHPPASGAAAPISSEGFAPEAGQEFLQVGAVGRDEAEAIADVLHKKGFRAHAVPKPGNSKVYRVLIGPIEDAADLSSTRDSLRKTGFREVIVQKY